MNFDMKKLGVDEVEIDIKSIFDRCIEKMKLVIIVGLIGLLVLPSVVYVKDSLDYKNSNAGGNTQKIELEDDELLAVEEYQLLLDRKMQIEKVLDESIFMEIDANNAYHIKHQYYFSSNTENGYDIACAVRGYIFDGILVDTLNKDLKPEDKKVNNDLFSSTIYENSAILNVEIFARTEAEAKKIATTMTAMINEYVKELNQNGLDCESKLIQDAVTCRYFWNVYDEQKGYLQDYKNVKNDIANKEKELNANQKLYLAMMDTEQDDTTDTVDNPKPAWSIKYAILGCGAGVVAALGAIVVFVLFGGRVQSAQEIQKRLQITRFGKVDADDDHIEMTISRVKALLGKDNIKNVKLISSVPMIDSKAAVLIEKLQANGIACGTVCNLLCDEKAVEALSQKETVILVESIGKTKVKDLYQEAIICEEMEAKIVGYVLV